MKAWQVLDEILERGDQKAIARDLNLSPHLVHSWTMPPEREGGNGHLSPIQRVIDMVITLRANGNYRADEIVRCINESLDFLPPIRSAGGSSIAELAHFLKETSEALAAHSRAHADGEYSIAELDELLREYGDVGSAVAGMMAFLRSERERAACRETSCES